MKHSMFTITAITALLLYSIAAAAIEGPQQKPGLWETRIQYSSSGKGADKTGTSQHCLDASVLAQSKQTAEDYARKNCSKNETRQEGGKWISDMACKVGSSTMSNHSVTEFSSDDAYHTEMTVTYDPPLAGKSATSTTVDGKWLGMCKP